MKLSLCPLTLCVLLVSACADDPSPRPRTISPPAAPAPSSGSPIGSFGHGAVDASAPTCKKTLCDLKAEHCENPPEPDYCDQCWSICEQNLDIALSCAESCNDLCKHKGPKVDVCGERLKACRRTKDNAICADGVETPTRGHPCGDVASELSCAKQDDADAQRAIYAANPQCEQCDDTWMNRCLDRTCQDEGRRFSACVQKAGCADGFLCERCDHERKAYAQCFWATMDDPRDVGGCNSGAHRCWTKPVCNPDGTAR